MEQLLFLLVILACPLMMMLMMRGSHGGHGDHMSADNARHSQVMADSDARIAELEHQVASLQTRLGSTTTRRQPGGGNRVGAGRAHAGVRSSTATDSRSLWRSTPPSSGSSR